MEVVEIPLLRDLLMDDPLREVLQIEIEAGVDAVTPTVVGVDLVVLRQCLEDVVDEIGCLELDDRWEDLQLDRIGRLGLRRGDVLLADHRGEHLRLSLLGGLQVHHRVVLRRCLR